MPDESHDWLFAGLRFKSVRDGQFTVIEIGGDGQTDPLKLPDRVFLGLCVIEDYAVECSEGLRNHVILRSQTCALVGNDFGDAVYKGAENHGILIGNAVGPINAENNRLGMTAVPFFTGGLRKSVGMLTKGIWFRNNLVFRDQKWNHNNAGAYAGIYTACKNLIEFKEGEEVVIEGNIFDGSWEGTGQQYGAGMVVKGTDQRPNTGPGNGLRSRVRNYTYRRNIMRNIATPIVLVLYDGGMSYPQQDMDIHENLFVMGENATMGPVYANMDFIRMGWVVIRNYTTIDADPDYNAALAGQPMPYTLSEAEINANLGRIAIRKNTFVRPTGNAHNIVFNTANGPAASRADLGIDLEDNIFTEAEYGLTKYGPRASRATTTSRRSSRRTSRPAATCSSTTAPTTISRRARRTRTIRPAAMRSCRASTSWTASAATSATRRARGVTSTPSTQRPRPLSPESDPMPYDWQYISFRPTAGTVTDRPRHNSFRADTDNPDGGYFPTPSAAASPSPPRSTPATRRSRCRAARTRSSRATRASTTERRAGSGSASSTGRARTTSCTSSRSGSTSRRGSACTTARYRAAPPSTRRRT